MVKNGPAPEGWNGPHESCDEGGSCGGDHTSCPPSQALLSPEQNGELRDLVYLAALGDAQSVEMILVEFAELASVRSYDRSLLIASSCSSREGEYAYSIALNEEQFAIATGG
mgnify:CR=1 FL=1